ncbi:MAG: class I SAM-dependent methyltransferase [Spirochaetales bacterium]|nr:class I SAM-dependent methyltransferase [Spirochaetales bacterium]
MKAPQDSVSTYYNKNTRRFIRQGEGGGALAIHRGIWAPGIQSPEQAANWVPQAMFDRLSTSALPAPTILDLGCGVGGTLQFLARKFGALTGNKVSDGSAGAASGSTVPAHSARILKFWGVTISTAQVDLGRTFLQQQGLGSTITLLHGDYTQESTFEPLPPIGAVLALESFLHSPDLQKTFQLAAGALAPGGICLVCDDMLSLEPEFLGPTDHAHLQRFISQWHGYGLTTHQRMLDLGAQVGLELVSDQDLTPFLRLFRPRDRFAAAVLPLLRGLRFFSGHKESPAWVQNLDGGTSLQRLLYQRTLNYRLLVWRKRA